MFEPDFIRVKQDSKETDEVLKKSLRDDYAKLTKAFSKSDEQKLGSVVELDDEITVDDLHSGLTGIVLCADMISASLGVKIRHIKSVGSSSTFALQKPEKQAQRHNLRVEVDKELNVTLRVANIILAQFNEKNPKRFLSASTYIAESPDANLTIREDDGFAVQYIGSLSGSKLDQPILSMANISSHEGPERKQIANYMMQGHANIVSLMRDIGTGVSTVMILY